MRTSTRLRPRSVVVLEAGEPAQRDSADAGERSGTDQLGESLVDLSEPDRAFGLDQQDGSVQAGPSGADQAAGAVSDPPIRKPPGHGPTLRR